MKFAVCIISASGASFCQVERISPVVMVIPWSTSGSQRWRGASPTFSARAVMAIAEVRGWDM